MTNRFRSLFKISLFNLCNHFLSALMHFEVFNSPVAFLVYNVFNVVCCWFVECGIRIQNRSFQLISTTTARYFWSPVILTTCRRTRTRAWHWVRSMPLMETPGRMDNSRIPSTKHCYPGFISTYCIYDFNYLTFNTAAGDFENIKSKLWTHSINKWSIIK